MSRRTLALVALLMLLAGAAVIIEGGKRMRASDGEANAGAAVATEVGRRVEVGSNAEVPAGATAVQPSPQHARIDDPAKILDPFAPRLGREADAFYDDLGIDIRIVTLNAADDAIESQADQIFQQRRIGADAPTGGLLIILNPELRAARIEVGYSLEGGLTDLHMGRLARDQLAPYTAYGAAGMAVMDVLHYLRDQVYLSAALGNLELGERFRRRPGFQPYEKFTSGGAGAGTKLSSVPMDADLKRTLPAGTRTRYAPATTVEGSVAAFVRAAADLAGDPTLELFTEGSRLMRTHYPLARFEELQRLERLQASMPLEFLERGAYAVATSRKPAKGFVPVLLHQEQGLWRIDLVETWKNLFFDRDGNYFLRNSNTAYAFGLTQFGAGRRYDIAPVALGGRTIAQALAALEGRQDAVSAVRRAEIWFRNAFVFPQAFAAYEAARRAAPNDPLILQMLGERAAYLGFPEVAIPALVKIGRGVELTLADTFSEMGDREAALQWTARALKENPYDWRALHMQLFLAKQAGRPAEVQEWTEKIAGLSADPQRLVKPVVLSFDPSSPVFHPDTSLDVNGTTVYDHSKFNVTMRNTSSTAVEIESVRLTSVGTAAASGLGDVASYWHFPNGSRRLLAGEAVTFDKQWGFTVDTGHRHVRYVFHTCWHGVAAQVRQCRTQWVDALPQ